MSMLERLLWSLANAGENGGLHSVASAFPVSAATVVGRDFLWSPSPERVDLSVNGQPQVQLSDLSMRDEKHGGADGI